MRRKFLATAGLIVMTVGPAHAAWMEMIFDINGTLSISLDGEGDTGSISISCTGYNLNLGPYLYVFVPSFKDFTVRAGDAAQISASIGDGEAWHWDASVNVNDSNGTVIEANVPADVFGFVQTVGAAASPVRVNLEMGAVKREITIDPEGLSVGSERFLDACEVKR